MLKTSFAPIFSTFPSIRLSPPKPPPHIIFTCFAHTATCSTKCLNQDPPPLRCHYCDFTIVALGAACTQTEDDLRMTNYAQLLCREINATKAENKAYRRLETVFFGGGTPSLVPPKLVNSVLETLRLKFGLSSGAEVSMDMNSGTFDAKKMKGLMELGVNRVSLGVQAFQEELLKACGRAHGVREVYEAMEIVGECGVENWSMDLISSLPDRTPEMWEESLRLTVEARPTHVSVYDLQVEQGTKFGLLYTPGEFPLPSEMRSAEFYKIDAYCKSGYHCKHNLTYWKNRPFYAFGLGSASYRMKEYTDYVENMENGLVECDESSRMVQDMDTDVVMLSLRTSRGLDLKYFGEAYVVFLDEQGRAIAADEFNTLLVNEDETERSPAYIRLSDPDGFLSEHQKRDSTLAPSVVIGDEKMVQQRTMARTCVIQVISDQLSIFKKLTCSSSRQWGGIAEKNMLRSIET
ncbi:unnamed protein product [Malus baccata var. baccata]